MHQPIETVITVCGVADAACPIFPGQVNRHHWPFDDPAHATGTDEEKMSSFRRMRDEIRRIQTELGITMTPIRLREGMVLVDDERSGRE